MLRRVVVLVVLAILVAWGWFAVQRGILRNRVSSVHGDFRYVSMRIRSFRIDNDRWPTRDELIQSIRAENVEWISLFIDPFKKGESDASFYDYHAEGNLWILRSYGLDGDADADLRELYRHLQESPHASGGDAARIYAEYHDTDDGDIVMIGGPGSSTTLRD